MVGLFRRVNLELPSILHFCGADQHLLRQLGRLIVITLEEKARLEFPVDLQGGIEQSVELGSEPVQRPYHSPLHQRAQLVFRQQPARDVFFDPDRQLGIAGLIRRIGLPEDQLPVDRVFHFHLGKVLVLCRLGETARSGNDLVRIADDPIHEIITLEFTLLHPAKFVFPLARQPRGI